MCSVCTWYNRSSMHMHTMLNNSEASRSKTETVEEKVPIGPHGMALAAVRHYVYG